MKNNQTNLGNQDKSGTRQNDNQNKNQNPNQKPGQTPGENPGQNPGEGQDFNRRITDPNNPVAGKGKEGTSETKKTSQTSGFQQGSRGNQGGSYTGQGNSGSTSQNQSKPYANTDMQRLEEDENRETNTNQSKNEDWKPSDKSQNPRKENK